jgi:hypothetical protein
MSAQAGNKGQHCAIAGNFPEAVFSFEHASRSSAAASTSELATCPARSDWHVAQLPIPCFT